MFDYLIHISESAWYADYKSKYQRFYFGIPKTFDPTWRPKSNLDGLSWDQIPTIAQSSESNFGLNDLFEIAENS